MSPLEFSDEEKALDCLSKIIAVDMIPKEIWNLAIEAVARKAKTFGPPNWSWSESSIVIKDTCEEIAEAILELKK